MGQLLRIESVSAQIQFESTRAKLKIQSPRAKLDIVRNVKGLSIKTQPARITISNRGLKESILALKPTISLLKEHAAEGIRAAQEATAAYAEEGNAMINKTTSVADIIARRFIPMTQTALAFIPQNGPEISFSQPNVDISYTPDDIQYNWKTAAPQVSYIPYDIRIRVTRYPEVKIEYIGEPLYFPK